jgi:hypothetical protein
MNFNSGSWPPGANWAEILFPLHTTVYKKMIRKMNKCCNRAQSGLRPEFKILAPRREKIASFGTIIIIFMSPLSLGHFIVFIEEFDFTMQSHSSCMHEMRLLP